MKKILILAILCASVGAHAGIAYDNTTTYTGFGYGAGGTISVGGILTTNMVLDDLTLAAGSAGQTLTTLKFSTVNFNALATTARMRLRFYNSDGASGGPGTQFAAVSFAATAIAPGATVWSSDFTSFGFVLPSNKIWTGVFFDNSGAANTTATELNNLGQAIFDPPTVGSSADTMFVTTTPSSFLANNPAGNFSNFGGNPHANFGWQLNSVPEPCTMIAAGLGLVAVVRRRKKA